jgi:hypothetical protein
MIYKKIQIVFTNERIFSLLTLCWPVGIAVMLRTKQSRNMGSISGRSNLFSIGSRTALGSHSLLSNGYWGKWAKRESLHPPSLNAKVKNVWSYTSTPAICLTVHRVAAARCYCLCAKLLDGATEHTRHSEKIAVQISFGFPLFYSACWTPKFRCGVLHFLVGGYWRFRKTYCFHIHCYPEDGSSRYFRIYRPLFYMKSRSKILSHQHYRPSTTEQM